MPPQWEREFGGENAAVDFIYIAALPRLVYASIVGIRMALVMMAELKLVHGTSRIMKSWLTKKQDEETREAVALGCRNHGGVGTVVGGMGTKEVVWETLMVRNRRSGVGTVVVVWNRRSGLGPKWWEPVGGGDRRSGLGTEVVVWNRWWWEPKKWRVSRCGVGTVVGPKKRWGPKYWFRNRRSGAETVVVVWDRGSGAETVVRYGTEEAVRRPL